MNIKINRLIITCLTIFVVFQILYPASVSAQRRDYLTEEEIELVRNSPEIDKRIEVLVRAIDRRFLVINQDNSQENQIRKDQDKWGPLPSGDRGQLLSDIRFLLQKAIDDIDDVAARQDSNQRVLEGGSVHDEDKNTARIIRNNDSKFPQAVHFLADASRRFIPQFNSLADQASERGEQGSIIRALEFCEMIVEASARIARPQKKK